VLPPSTSIPFSLPAVAVEPAISTLRHRCNLDPSSSPSSSLPRPSCNPGSSPVFFYNKLRSWDPRRPSARLRVHTHPLQIWPSRDSWILQLKVDNQFSNHFRSPTRLTNANDVLSRIEPSTDRSQCLPKRKAASLAMPLGARTRLCCPRTICRRRPWVTSEACHQLSM
jgi:hypothetical protein